MSHRRCVLFDLDGTLIDTAPDFVRVLNMLRARHQRPPLPHDLIRSQVSNGAAALVRLGFGLDDAAAEFPRLREELLAIYADNLCIDSHLFPSLDHLLLDLDRQGIAWGIVTNKPRRYAEPLLRQLGLAERCASLVCPDDVSQRKPHPEPIVKAMAEVAVDAAATIYVGDHRRDIDAGRAADVLTIAAAYGYVDDADPAEQWQADAIAQDAHDLHPLIMQHLNRL